MAIQQEMIREGCSEELVVEEGRLVSQIEERRKQEEILWRQMLGSNPNPLIYVIGLSHSYS